MRYCEILKGGLEGGVRYSGYCTAISLFPRWSEQFSVSVCQSELRMNERDRSVVPPPTLYGSGGGGVGAILQITLVSSSEACGQTRAGAAGCSLEVARLLTATLPEAQPLADARTSPAPLHAACAVGQ